MAHLRQLQEAFANRQPCRCSYACKKPQATFLSAATTAFKVGRLEEACSSDSLCDARVDLSATLGKQKDMLAPSYLDHHIFFSKRKSLTCTVGIWKIGIRAVPLRSALFLHMRRLDLQKCCARCWADEGMVGTSEANCSRSAAVLGFSHTV